jgi:hypothetical protein
MAACATESETTTISPGSSPTSVPPALIATTALPTSLTQTKAPTIEPAVEAARPAETESERNDSMKIRITIDGMELTATMIDSKTTQGFLALLPLTVTLEDYAGTEKIYYLPERLSIEGAPSGSDPSVGDIAYYAPWGNLAIFYRDFGYSDGLIILGKIDGDVEAIRTSGPVTVTIEQMD